MKGAKAVVLLMICMGGAACEGAFQASDLGSMDGSTATNGTTGTDTMNQTDSTVMTPEMVSTGAELYSLYCEVCHGPEAAGGPTWGSPIQGYEPIHDIVANGRSTMAAVPIDDADIALIQAYLLSLGLPDWSQLSGEEVFQAGCASCHGQEAQGTTLGPQLRFRDGAYFKYVTRHGGWSSNRFASPMETYGTDRISDAQLDQMVAWIAEFGNADTPKGLYDQFCANCHGGTDIRARINEGLDEGSITGVCRSGKEDSVANRNYMPGWSTAEISDSELAMIQQYINTL